VGGNAKLRQYCFHPERNLKRFRISGKKTQGNIIPYALPREQARVLQYQTGLEAHSGYRLSSNKDAARRRGVDASNEVEQGGFPAA
jgi:hypothetical protein